MISHEEFFEEIERRQQAIQRWCESVRQEFEAHRIVVVDNGRFRYALHRSSRRGVNYQVSWWSDGEPGGHRDHQDFDEAAKELFFELPDVQRRSLESGKED